MQLHLFLLCIFLYGTAQARVVRPPPLIQAVQGERMYFLQQLIKGGAEINAIDAWGRTAAHYAVLRNNLPALEFLLTHGADANLADNDGNAPLDVWPKHENEKILVLLHEAGAKSSHNTEVALQPPKDTAVSQPLNANKVAPSADKTKNSAQDLFQAAANNDRDSAERLLAAGADAAAPNAEGKVPFMVAIEAEHYALAAILLKAAVGINGRDDKSWSPLHWAVLSDDWDLVREFMRAGADITAGRTQNVFDVAKSMKSEAQLIEVFIAEQGVNATTGRYGSPMLIFAAERGHTEIVKFLIDAKANLNIKTNYGYTASMLAAKGGHTEIVKFLIEAEADMNITDNFGKTTLMYAAKNGGTEVARLLIENKGDMNITDDHYGETALVHAAKNGRTEIVRLLIAAKADVNIKANYGYTALMLAASGGHTEIVKFLIDAKTNLNIKTNYGHTALMLAAKGGYTEVVKFLIDAKANLNITDKKGESALDFAKKRKVQEMVDSLRAAQTK